MFWDGIFHWLGWVANQWATEDFLSLILNAGIMTIYPDFYVSARTKLGSSRICGKHFAKLYPHAKICFILKKRELVYWSKLLFSENDRYSYPSFDF